ncbi:hypothetical protein K491DRAFT_679402 [Lophiostoma macrostomum CBS 122681]|uniref:Uncharacterized protein n=1 Tax=Lophiostoma macrostomum CBS 122681 TaxID=1314788 RepID=A0A6A6T594_9PLEO|nr:hypothetical protein K491DRAFT_679402 [Lophiostoma macrostomum CBS 122681]
MQYDHELCHGFRTVETTSDTRGDARFRIRLTAPASSQALCGRVDLPAPPLGSVSSRVPQKREPESRISQRERETPSRAVSGRVGHESLMRLSFYGRSSCTVYLQNALQSEAWNNAYNPLANHHLGNRCETVICIVAALLLVGQTAQDPISPRLFGSQVSPCQWP